MTSDNELEASLEQALAEVKATPAPELAQPRMPTLVEQLSQLQDIQRKWWDQVHEARAQLQESYERRIHEINQNYGRRIHDAKVKLERDRDEELRLLGENYQRKLGEFNALSESYEKL